MGIIIAILAYLVFIVADAVAMTYVSDLKPEYSRWYGMPGYGIWLWIKAKGWK